jgi:hypothetical protein
LQRQVEEAVSELLRLMEENSTVKLAERGDKESEVLFKKKRYRK